MSDKTRAFDAGWYKKPRYFARIREPYENGWVIEHRRSPAYEPSYWAGNGWSTDHLRAIRFARQIDAERTAAGFDEDDSLPGEEPHRTASLNMGGEA